MLWKVDTTNSRGDVLSLELDNVVEGYAVADIDGLDPVKATLVSSSFGQLNGSEFQSSRREERNIVLKVEFEPDYAETTVRALRKKLYRYFMPESAIRMQMYLTDDPEVWIFGRVESFETAIFSEKPAVDISIMCFDPDFFNPLAKIVEGMSTATDDEDLINYEGDLETGFEFKLDVDRTISEFTIYHRPPDGTLRIIDFQSPMVAGDNLVISTIQGRKFVMKNTTTSLLYAISPQSNWLELQPGPNYIRVYAEGAPIPYDIRYTDKYGGL